MLAEPHWPAKQPKHILSRQNSSYTDQSISFVSTPKLTLVCASTVMFELHAHSIWTFQETPYLEECSKQNKTWNQEKQASAQV